MPIKAQPMVLTREELWRRFDINENWQLVYKIAPSSNIKIGDIVTGANNEGYLRVGINHKRYLVHKIIFFMLSGEYPDILDHIDGNTKNNNINNLRTATQKQNSANCKRRKNSSSQYKGVHWKNKNKLWCAQIGANGEKTYIGLFLDEVEAAKAYDRAAIKYFGEFARLNFPKEDYNDKSVTL